MDICDFVEQALDGICPVYAPTPEFSGDEPPKYVIYDITQRGAEYAEGLSYADEYTVSLNVFSRAFDFELYAKLKAAMQAAGASFVGGGNTGNDVNFPYIKQYYLDFGVVLEQ